MSSSNDSFASNFVESHPPNKRIPVYINPNQPSDSVLLQGIRGSDLFMVMFLTPFNFIMVGGWYLLFATFFGKATSAPGYPVVDEGRRIRVKLSRIPSIFCAICVIFGAAFISTFVVAFAFGFHPSLITMFVVWGIILLAASVTWLKCHRKNCSGRYDLVQNKFQQTIDLPATYGREEVSTYPLKNISEAIVELEKSKSPDGESIVKHNVVLTLKDRYPPSGKIEECPDEQEANALANWLNQNFLTARPECRKMATTKKRNADS